MRILLPLFAVAALSTSCVSRHYDFTDPIDLGAPEFNADVDVTVDSATGPTTTTYNQVLVSQDQDGPAVAYWGVLGLCHEEKCDLSYTVYQNFFGMDMVDVYTGWAKPDSAMIKIKETVSINGKPAGTATGTYKIYNVTAHANSAASAVAVDSAEAGELVAPLAFHPAAE